LTPFVFTRSSQDFVQDHFDHQCRIGVDIRRVAWLPLMNAFTGLYFHQF
jgi:hypothetical protein